MRLGSIILLITLVALPVVSYLGKIPEVLYPQGLHGVALASSLNTEGKVWIVSDDSLSWYGTIETGTRRSTGLHRLNCRVNLYLYDPLQKKVLRKFAIKCHTFPQTCRLEKVGNTVWLLFEGTDDDERIWVFDAISGGLQMDTRRFLAEHRELTAGVAALDYEENPPRLKFQTKTGDEFVYFFEDGTLTRGGASNLRAKVKQLLGKRGRESRYLFEKDPGGGKKQLLYRLSGPAIKLIDGGIGERDLERTLLTPEVGYIEPILVHQDESGVWFLHLDRVGSSAKRMLTCVDSSGRKKWTVPPDQLFPKLMLTEADPFSSSFFIGCSTTGEKVGGTLVLKVEKSGSMGFDAESGKKLWEIEL